MADSSEPTTSAVKRGAQPANEHCRRKVMFVDDSRRTRRWPMVVFFRVLDLSGVNAYVLFNQEQEKKIERGDFLKTLARSLVLPHAQRRVLCTKLPRELRLTITRILGADVPPAAIQAEEVGPKNRKRCRFCPSKLSRKTTHACINCKKPVCLQCSKPLCSECQ